VAALAVVIVVLAGGAVLVGVLSTKPAQSPRSPGRVVRPPAPVSAVNAVESNRPVTDAAGKRWAPDQFSHGGSLVQSSAAVEYTASPDLYRGERVGIESISVPLQTNGSYLVVLYFAETSSASAGQRTFDVLAQGRQVAAVDIARDVGTLTPYHLAFTEVVSQRHLTIQFVPHNGRPILSALQVRHVAPSIRLPPRRRVWNDEFGGAPGTSPNRGHWTYDMGPGWNQLADYTSEPANASLDGHGHLLLRAWKNTLSSSPGTRADPITSVRMTTRGLLAMRFGMAEARIQAIGQPGFVSTFWALGTNIADSGWPASGEIDPGEVRGMHENILVQALHMPCGHRDCPVVWHKQLDTSLAAGFHTFAVERAPGVVVYMVDGRQTGSLTAADVARGSWVFDRPFYLLLNVIVGGWGGTPSASTNWPATMSVDWVRVFK
jgi:hypothetical protein